MRNLSWTMQPASVAIVDDRASGGARRDRTDDLMLAKHALSQLSYGPLGECVSIRRQRDSSFAKRMGESADDPIGSAARRQNAIKA